MATTLKISILMLFLALATDLALCGRVLEEATTSDVTPQPDAAQLTSTVPTPEPTGAPGAPSLTFYMHDVIGGTQASARIVTGIIASSGIGSQFPFSKPNKDVFPVNGGVPLPSTFTAANLPSLTGLANTGTTAGLAQTNSGTLGTNQASGLPFVNSGSLPGDSTLRNLLFGTTTVIDDELTEGPELGAAVVGRGQGMYVASSQDGTSRTMMFTAAVGKEREDSVSFFGVHRTAAEESHVAVVGGTGKYERAGGFAVIGTVGKAEEGTTDGAETVVKIDVYLS